MTADKFTSELSKADQQSLEKDEDTTSKKEPESSHINIESTKASRLKLPINPIDYYTETTKPLTTPYLTYKAIDNIDKYKNITDLPHSISKAISILDKYEHLVNLPHLTAKYVTALHQQKHFKEILPVHDTIAAMMQRESRLFSQLTREARALKNISNIIEPYNVNNRSIIDSYHNKTIQELILNKLSLFNKLYSSASTINPSKLIAAQLSQAALAHERAFSNLDRIIKNADIISQKQALSSRLFDISNTYSDFVRHTTERLISESSIDVAIRLRSSLNLAEYQLLGITDSISNIDLVPEDDYEPSAKRFLNAPLVQQAELIVCDNIKNENDTELLISSSQTARIAQKARQISRLIVLCNEAGKTSPLGVDIFKPTTRLMESCIELPWISATDKRQFGEVIDCLYFIFYEAAGKDSLRFLDTNGGPLAVSDCDLIWCIKHLRNKWSRHDADHGREKDIQRSWTELSAKLQWLGLANYPVDDRDFHQLHYRLFELAEDFLRCILNKIKLGNSKH